LGAVVCLFCRGWMVQRLIVGGGIGVFGVQRRLEGCRFLFPARAGILQIVINSLKRKQ
jgi:hypothetical protein